MKPPTRPAGARAQYLITEHNKATVGASTVHTMSSKDQDQDPLRSGESSGPPLLGMKKWRRIKLKHETLVLWLYRQPYSRRWSPAASSKEDSEENSKFPGSVNVPGTIGARGNANLLVSRYGSSYLDQGQVPNGTTTTAACNGNGNVITAHLVDESDMEVGKQERENIRREAAKKAAEQQELIIGAVRPSCRGSPV
jgi:hypothetical protein